MEATQISSNEYKRLGDRIRQNPKAITPEDLDAIQFLRSSYKPELASLFSVLIKVVRTIDKQAIVTYRIKRIESIVSKLLRQPKMHINRMADIAGCRCIVKNDDQVWRVYEALKEVLVIVNENDYITESKEDGYRSLHLNVRIDQNSTKTMEIQIRSVDEHNWATLVEITDLVFASKIKEKGEGDMAEFHKLLSKDINNLTLKERYRIFQIATANHYFKKVSSIFSRNYIEVRETYNEARISGAKYFLLATGEDGKPEIQPYRSFDDAEADYYVSFRENKDNKNIVLTYIHNATFDEISMAYSNYFLTYNALFFKCYSLLSTLVVECYHSWNSAKFYKMYSAFLEFTEHLYSVQLLEHLEFTRSKIVLKSLKKRANWFNSIKNHMNNIRSIFNDTQRNMGISKNMVNSAIKRRLTTKFLKHIKEIKPYEE